MASRLLVNTCLGDALSPTRRKATSLSSVDILSIGPNELMAHLSTFHELNVHRKSWEA